MKTKLLSLVVAFGVLSAPGLAQASGSLSKAVGINTLISAKLGQLGAKSDPYATTGSKSASTSYAPAPKVLPPKVAPPKTETIYQPVTQPVIQPIHRIIQPVVSTVVQPVIHTSYAAPIYKQPTYLAPKFVGASYAPSHLGKYSQGSKHSYGGSYGQLAKASGIGGHYGSGYGGYGGKFSNYGRASGYGKLASYRGGYGNFGGYGSYPRFGGFHRFAGFGGKLGFGGYFGGSANPIAAILGGRLGSESFSYSLRYTRDGVNYELDLSGRVSASFHCPSASPSSVSHY